MAQFKNSEVIVNQEECRRCFICQLVCSAVYERNFNPSMARIRIGLTQRKDGKYVTPISFTEDCTGCGLCASYCHYGALTIVKRSSSEKAEEVYLDYLGYR